MSSLNSLNLLKIHLAWKVVTYVIKVHLELPGTFWCACFYCITIINIYIDRQMASYFEKNGFSWTVTNIKIIDSASASFGREI